MTGDVGFFGMVTAEFIGIHGLKVQFGSQQFGKNFVIMPGGHAFGAGEIIDLAESFRPAGEVVEGLSDFATPDRLYEKLTACEKGNGFTCLNPGC